jgi:DNA-binding beta-propeller fold protein YncE
VSLVPTGAITFLRALAVDLSDPNEGFTNLVQSYNLLTTIAGAGGIGDDGVNKWQPEFEGSPATNALLSRPHIGMADDAGNIFIADKDSHAIRKIQPDGTLVTVAGTNAPGDGPDEPTPASEVALNQPNGLWVRGDGTVYILDLMNGKVRRLGTNGMVSTLFAVPGGIFIGRGLWVKDDESVAFVCAGDVVKKWTPVDGVTDYATNFVELGNLVVDPRGDLVVTDRRGHRVWRLFDDGTRLAIAGDGTTVGMVVTANWPRRRV